jgi:hypothetical protein
MDSKVETDQGVKMQPPADESQGLKSMELAGDSQGVKMQPPADESQGLKSMELAGDSQGVKMQPPADESKELAGDSQGVDRNPPVKVHSQPEEPKKWTVAVTVKINNLAISNDCRSCGYGGTDIDINYKYQNGIFDTKKEAEEWMQTMEDFHYDINLINDVEETWDGTAVTIEKKYPLAEVAIYDRYFEQTFEVS